MIDIEFSSFKQCIIIIILKNASWKIPCLRKCVKCLIICARSSNGKRNEFFISLVLLTRMLCEMLEFILLQKKYIRRKIEMGNLNKIRKGIL